MGARLFSFVIMMIATTSTLAQDGSSALAEVKSSTLAQDASHAKCHALYREAGAIPGTSRCPFNASMASIGMATRYCTSGTSIIEAYCREKPQPDCKSHPVLSRYEDVRDQDLPKLENLSESEKDFMKMVFTIILDGLKAYVSEAVHNPIPLEILDNAGNLYKMAHGHRHGNEKEEIEGIVHFTSNTAWKLLPSNFMENMMYDFLAALKPNAPRTLAEQQDHVNRSVVAESLKADGCPADLTSDYHLPPYQSPKSSK